MEQYQQRRAEDERLNMILESLREVKQDTSKTRESLNALSILHAGYHADISRRMTNAEEEIKNHSDEIKVINGNINVSAGQKSVVKYVAGGVFGTIGGAVMWIGEHLLSPLIKKGH